MEPGSHRVWPAEVQPTAEPSQPRGRQGGWRWYPVQGRWGWGERLSHLGEPRLSTASEPRPRPLSRPRPHAHSSRLRPQGHTAPFPDPSSRRFPHCGIFHLCSPLDWPTCVFLSPTPKDATIVTHSHHLPPFMVSSSQSSRSHVHYLRALPAPTPPSGTRICRPSRICPPCSFSSCPSFHSSLGLRPCARDLSPRSCSLEALYFYSPWLGIHPPSIQQYYLLSSTLTSGRHPTLTPGLSGLGSQSRPQSTCPGPRPQVPNFIVSSKVTFSAMSFKVSFFDILSPHSLPGSLPPLPSDPIQLRPSVSQPASGMLRTDIHSDC